MLTCAACGHANPAGGKFCLECGNPLARACQVCGAPVGGSKFCGECGAAQLVAAPPQPASTQAERRVCSVLFVDLVGFTPFTEGRDSEDVRAMLSQYFDRARTIVERYGGVIEKFIGDAVMAIWGTPVATEGDAERAVRAGLEIVDSVAELGGVIGAVLAARAGVVTGDVAVTVGMIGEGVAGDTVNTAARVQSVAESGSVWVDDVTRRVAQSVIGFQDAGEHVLKGKADALHLWRATRVLSTVSRGQRIDGLEGPLLGRDVERRTINELFHAAVERRASRLVLVSGPAGSGKSRLGWEFRTYIEGLAETMLWHSGRCLSYGNGVAFWALAEAVRQRFGISEDDPAEVAAHKLATRLPDFVTDMSERDYVGARLARLLGVSYGADSGVALPREELFAGWRLFFERLAMGNPVILAFEDLHQADSGLLAFLDHLVDWSRNVPIYILAMARPELGDTAAGWGTGRNRTTITLDSLDPESMDRLVESLVPGMPAATRAALVSQAQGIPLYAVETVRSLIDRDIVIARDGEYRLVGDVSTLAVPDTLRGLLAARYDALPSAIRALLADAAVLGTSFPAEALVAVSGRDEAEVRRGLDDLVRREILDVSADPLSPQRGFYGFSQNLLRQVVYDTMSRHDRRAKHLAVAAHLRSTFAGDGDEIVEVIAAHYVDALTASGADDDTSGLFDETIAALVRAADRAERAGALSRAATHLTSASELLMGSGDRRRAAHLLERASSAALSAGLFDAAIDHAQEGQQLYESLGHERDAARLQMRRAEATRWLGRSSEAAVLARGALDRLREPADTDTVYTLALMSRMASIGGDAPAAGRYSAEALQLSQALGVERGLFAEVFTGRGLAMQHDGRYEEAIACFDHAVSLAGNEGDIAARLRALANLSDVQLTTNPEAALEAAGAVREIARRLGNVLSLGVGYGNAVDALVWRGLWDDAAQLLLEAVDEGLGNLLVLQQSSAMLAALRGEPTIANEPAIPLDLDVDDLQDAMYAAVAEFARAAAEGDDARVVGLAHRMLQRGLGLGPRSETVVWCWTIGLRSARAIGDQGATRELLELVTALPPGHLPKLVRAELALAAALGAGAEADLTAAVGALRAAGSPYHLAHGLLDQAAATSDPAVATAALDEAAALNEVLRAPALARRMTPVIV